MENLENLENFFHLGKFGKSGKFGKFFPRLESLENFFHLGKFAKFGMTKLYQSLRALVGNDLHFTIILIFSMPPRYQKFHYECRFCYAVVNYNEPCQLCEPETMAEPIQDMIPESPVSTQITKQNTYPEENKLRDCLKLFINQKLSKLASQCFKHCEIDGVTTAALYLDSSSGITTLNLLAEGYNIQHLHAPNWDLTTVTSLKTKFPGINTGCMEIGEYVAQYNDLPLSCIWIDAQTMWKLNTAHAIQVLILARLIAPYAVIGFTANIRNMPGKRSTTAREDCERNVETIKQWLASTQRYVCGETEFYNSPTGSSESQMYTCFLKVVRI